MRAPGVKSLPLPEQAAPARAPLLRSRPAEPLPGYRLLEPLGRGSVGEVWKCEAPGGLAKAVKFVPLPPGEEATRVEALQRVKGIRHPGLLFLDRVKIVGAELVLVTELAEKNLREVLRRWQAAGLPGVPREVLLSYLRDAAEALDVLGQRHGLLHRNVRPENLLVLGDRVKVADAGLEPPDLHQTPYAAPEQRLGAPGRNSDQYSLALVYRELLTGRPAADGPELPEGDRAILARALADDPEERFPSCAEFVRALAAANDTSPGRETNVDVNTPLRPLATSLVGAGPTREEDEAPARPVLQPGSCAGLPGYRFLTCLGRQPGGESWVVALPDGRTRLARIVHHFGDLNPAREREAVQRLTDLSHPALLRFEKVHAEPGRVILITELAGTSLRDRFEECRRQRLPGVPRPELLGYLRTVADALDDLHKRSRLQHLGLHPGAVLFQRGRVLLMNFGLAQLFWLGAGQPVDDGNARYAAPELLAGEAGNGCDQYSLALMYQELLTGLNPFRYLSRPRTPSDRPRRRPDLGLLPASDRDIILRALERDPRQRFVSCTELVIALEDATPRKEREAGKVITSLPAIIAWPSVHVGSAAVPAQPLPSLEQLLPELIARASGGVRVREYHGIRYALDPGRSLQHRCAAWLPPGVAQIKLTGFAQQWGAEIVRCEETTFLCYVDVPGTLWQRCLGRQLGLEVSVRLRQPPAAVAKLTEVDVALKPHGASKAQHVPLLWEVGPRLLESLRTHLQARPEQRLQPRLLCQHPMHVAPVRPDLQLAASVECQGKDISQAGIGFFLPDQLTTPQVYLNLGDEVHAAELGLLAKIVRVQPCGDGWYEVGAAFPVEEPRGQ
jgi:serine/threonine protein kinase